MEHGQLGGDLFTNASAFFVRNFTESGEFTESGKEVCKVEMIPNEILQYIFGNLNEVQDLAAVSLTSRTFYECSKKRFEQLFRKIEKQIFIHEKLPTIMNLLIRRIKDVNAINEFEMVTPKKNEETKSKEGKEVSISMTSIACDNQFTKQQRGILLAIAVGKFFSNWAISLKSQMRDVPIDSDLRTLFENGKLFDIVCRSVKELKLAPFNDTIKMVQSVDNFLNILKEQCPRVKKFILPPETQDTELARLMKKYPSFTFVIAKESGEKELQ